MLATLPAMFSHQPLHKGPFMQRILGHLDENALLLEVPAIMQLGSF